MDLLDVQPSRTSLTQNFDDIGRFEEPEGRGKLTLQVASDEEYIDVVKTAIRTHSRPSINADQGLLTVVESWPHAATMRFDAAATAGSPFSASARSSSGVYWAVR